MTSTTTGTAGAERTAKGSSLPLPLRLGIAWTIVGVPLAYGVIKTVEKASALFS